MEKTKFDSEISRHVNYYVYLLVDKKNDEIFYVGKGKNDRIFDHTYEALKDEIENSSDKIKRIKDLNQKGDIEYFILRHALSENEALMLEASIIDLLKNSKFKSLHNLTNKNRGFHYNTGLMSVKEVIEKYSKGELDTDNLEHNILAINLNKSHERENIYEAVRKYWRIDIRRASKMDYVVAENNGVIIGIFKANKWHSLDSEGKESVKDSSGRKYFEGEEVTDPKILDLYLYKRLPKVHGAQNPIRYYQNKKSK